MTGPISTPSSRPLPTTRELAICPIASANGSAASPTVMAREAARQRWPAHPNALSAAIVLVMSMSASGNTTIGFLAPPCACTRLPAADAVA